jgi:hypothetical protein
MDNYTLITALGYVMTPIASVLTWIVSRKKQRNDFLRDMQASIDLLANENKKLMEEVVALRKENMKLREEVEELNRKLENVRTITKKYKDETN